MTEALQKKFPTKRKPCGEHNVVSFLSFSPEVQPGGCYSDRCQVDRSVLPVDARLRQLELPDNIPSNKQS